MVKNLKNLYSKRKKKNTCVKNILVFFKKKLSDWKNRFKSQVMKRYYNSSLDDNSTSADIVDQASSYTEKNVEMRAINRQIKLISKIDSALKKFKMVHMVFVKKQENQLDLKRLMARPVATLCIAAQEKHEKEEKVYADD